MIIYDKENRGPLGVGLGPIGSMGPAFVQETKLDITGEEVPETDETLDCIQATC